jgi:hypothetical protein
MTPAARSRGALERLGWEVLPPALVRHEDFGTEAVACVTSGTFAARERRALADPRLVAWLRAGRGFHVHEWISRAPGGPRRGWGSGRLATIVLHVARLEGDRVRFVEVSRQ